MKCEWKQMMKTHVCLLGVPQNNYASVTDGTVKGEPLTFQPINPGGSISLKLRLQYEATVLVRDGPAAMNQSGSLFKPQKKQLLEPNPHRRLWCLP